MSGFPKRQTRPVRYLLGISPIKDKEGGNRSRQKKTSDPSAGQIRMKGEREERTG